MSSTRLQHNSSSSSNTSWGRLEDVLQRLLEDVSKMSWRHIYEMKTSWRRLWRRKIVTLKASSRHVLKTSNLLQLGRFVITVALILTCLKDVFKTFWRQKKCLLGISVSSKSNCHKFISDESKANPKCINENPMVSILVVFWNSSSISVLRIKISGDCLVLYNQLNSNSTLQNRWGSENEVLSNIPHKYI